MHQPVQPATPRFWPVSTTAPDPHQRARQVRVQRRPAVAHVDLHDPAVAREARRLADLDHPARRGGGDAERPQAPDVDAGVPAVAVAAEGRRDRPVSRPAELELPAAVGVAPRRRSERQRARADEEEPPHDAAG